MQTPQEVADVIYNTFISKSDESTVGLPYAAAQIINRHTGLNPATIPFMHI